MKVVNKLNVNTKTFNNLCYGAVFVLADRVDDLTIIPMMKIETINPTSMSRIDSANAIDLTNGAYDWVHEDEKVVEIQATLTLEKM